LRFHFVWAKDDNEKDFISGEVISIPTIVNVGLGKYFGISFADDLSMISANVGYGWGSLISINPPLDFDFSLGFLIYDWLHLTHINEEACDTLRSSYSGPDRIIFNPDFLKSL